jgi:AraC-like DNA-binding protein
MPVFYMPSNMTSHDLSFKEHVDSVIYQRISDPELSIGDVAFALNMGRTMFFSSFKREIGTPPTAYIRAIRLELSAQLLRETTLTIQQVSAETGFRHLAYFTKRFREHFGTTPSTFRLAHSKKHIRFTNNTAP